MTTVIGIICVFAIFGGLLAEKFLGTELATILFFGGMIVGSINVLIGVFLMFASMFKK